MQIFSLGYSPCPNDTFIFHALTHGLVSTPGLCFKERLEDVETLNRLVLEKALDVSKISYHLLGFIREDYCLLTAGGALGRGCGPLVVSKGITSMGQLKGKRIALPGKYTTAALLLRLFDPSLTDIVYLPFDQIMGAIADGSVDAGVIIHESRFTYGGLGLIKLLDLGDWWEKETGCPIPLGGIVARRSLGSEIITAINGLLRRSVEAAFADPQTANAYIRSHSQEMSDEVCAAHIKLYVNAFSRDLGQEGKHAVNELLGRAGAKGLIPTSTKDIFRP
jgi:1,4-dihydroxy-6-naphthoate synthase